VAIVVTVLERVDAEHAAGSVAGCEQLLGVRELERVDVDRVGQRVDSPRRRGGAVEDHLAERFTHRDRRAGRHVQLAEGVSVVARRREHPLVRDAVPDAVVCLHPRLAEDRAVIVDRENLAHRRFSLPVEPAALLMGPSRAGAGGWCMTARSAEAKPIRCARLRARLGSRN